MKNPWKRLSKINPQKEDGTRQINSDVLHALIKAKLPTAEMGVVLTVISKTWGFNKRSDAISISQLAELTGFTPRAIKKAKAALEKRRIIIVSCSKRVYRGSPLNEYMFNKHYDTWKSQDRKRVNCGSRGERRGKKRVNAGTPTIETITIEKEILKYLLPHNSESILNFCKKFIEHIQTEKKNLAPKSDDLLKNSCETVDKLIRIDEFDLEYIKAVLRWAVKDSFWGKNVLSLASLRTKKDGLTKFQKVAADFDAEQKKQAGPRGVNGSSRSEQNAKACDDFVNEMMQECGNYE